MAAPLLHPDRLFPADPGVRALARELFAQVEALPILSPHGHCDPAWFAADAPFPDPASLIVTPDHYVLRLLVSQGVSLESLGVAPRDGGPFETDPRAIWRRFAEGYRLFAGTPSRLWLDFVFAEVFGLQEPLGPATADAHYDAISEALMRPEFRPRALYERFGVEALATTEGALDPLDHHRAVAASGWGGRIVPTFRPDGALDPDQEDFRDQLAGLCEATGEDALSWPGYLAALRARRAHFIAHGARASDHGPPSAASLDLSEPQAEALFARVARGAPESGDAEAFRAHMLVRMAEMSVEDGLVMQLHAGALRNHDPATLARFGRDKGADMPQAVDFVRGLAPLLHRFGHAEGFTLIAFTLDETTYSRELAPLAGFYPALKLGAPWWFHDSPQGMRRFREQATETAGFFNTVGFTDDTRAFLSIPARHDLARRMDCAFLARLAAEHRLRREEAADIARALAYDLAKAAYRL